MPPANHIQATFLRLVREHEAAVTSRRAVEITKPLLQLIDFCNPHCNDLKNLQEDPFADPQSRVWLAGLATVPSGEWAEVRLMLSPFICRCGLLPRPRYDRTYIGLRFNNNMTGTFIPGTGFVFDRGQYVDATFQSASVSIIPEPSAALLGLAGMTLLFRRRRIG